MEEKRAVKIFLGYTVTILLLIAAWTIIIDPFFHYHAPWFGMTAVQTKKEYQVNGAIEHLEYNAILAGSSTAANINTSIIDQKYNCHTQKAIAASASTSVLCYYLNKAYQNHELDYVFYSLDFFSLFREISTDPVDDQVIYLRDKNPFNDVEYLWNMDVLGWDVPNMIAVSLHPSYDEGMAYNFIQFDSLGIEEVLSAYKQADEISEMELPDKHKDCIEENLNLIKEIIEAHPETDFYFVIPAYSIIYWDREYRGGTTEEAFWSLKQAVIELSAYDNVVFSGGLFNDFDTVMNLNNYTDLAHASYEKNCEWATIMIQKDHLLNEDNIDEEIDLLRKMIMDYENRLENDGNWVFLYEYTE